MLEAAAAAEDPHLASRLKGSPASRLRAVAPVVYSYLRGLSARVLRLRWWGVPVSIAGLALVVLGMAAGLAVSIAGALVAAAGLRMLAQIVEDRRVAPRKSDG